VARKKIRLRQLDELDLGDFEGMSIAEIATRMPDEYAALKAQPLQYRFPRGESFGASLFLSLSLSLSLSCFPCASLPGAANVRAADLIQRLEPLVFEIERIRHPLLIVSHRHVLQCLYTYLTDRPPSQAPFIDIPANAVLELSPLAFRCSETIHELLKNRSIPANTSKET
jgi:broad specificity phosphatase PhoE